MTQTWMYWVGTNCYSDGNGIHHHWEHHCVQDVSFAERWCLGALEHALRATPGRVVVGGI